jgi:antitoxin HicB
MSDHKRFAHNGSTFDSFLREERILEETETLALKRVIAWQLQRAMKTKRISKYAMAKRLRTSRSQVDRLLDPVNIGVTLGTLSRAAQVVGKRIVFQVVDDRRRPPRARSRKRPAAAWPAQN